MATTYPNILKAGTQAGYNSLLTKDENSLYFCTDTGKIYKGSIDMTDSTVIATSKPETPVVGKLYFLADTNTVEVYTGTEWKVVSYPTVTTINASSDDMHVATAKSVYDAIQAAVEDITGGSTVVKSVEASETEGKIKVTKGDGSSADVAVKGVVTTPTWDADARKLTLPVVDGTAVEVNIGKDIFINPNADNKYNADTKEIWLYLNDGTEEKEDTLIKVPTAGLVDIYTGKTTDTITTTVSDGNVIEATLKIDPASENAITSSVNGIKVDLTSYALTADVNSQVSDLQDAIGAVKTTADTAAADIAILKGNNTTEGSIAKAIYDVQTTLQGNIDTVDGKVTALTERVTTVETDVDTVEENLAALAAATTVWGTF